MTLFTRSGIHFDVFNPKPEMVQIEDIATSLSRECRYGNHCKYFYSVAEHSYHLSKLVTDLNEARWLFLHDGSEAYLRDIPRDLKRSPLFAEYVTVEEKVQNAVFERFGVTQVDYDKLKRLDDRIVSNELEKLFDNPPQQWVKIHPPEAAIPNLIIHCWPDYVAKEVYLRRYRELFDG